MKCLLRSGYRALISPDTDCIESTLLLDNRLLRNLGHAGDHVDRLVESLQKDDYATMRAPVNTTSN